MFNFQKILLKVNFNNPTQNFELMRKVDELLGVYSVATDRETGVLTIMGCIDHVTLLTHAMKFDKTARIISGDDL